MKIVWTPRAEKGFEAIMGYLDKHWAQREKLKFFNEFFDALDLIASNPKLLPPSGSKKNLHRGPINSQTIITYKLDRRKNRIILINVRASRQKPV